MINEIFYVRWVTMNVFKQIIEYTYNVSVKNILPRKSALKPVEILSDFNPLVSYLFIHLPNGHTLLGFVNSFEHRIISLKISAN